MSNSRQSEALTEQMEISSAKTQELSPILPPDKTKEDFRDGQSKILEMIARNDPLEEILSRLVLLIEAQSPGMLCSVLLLSDDGNHVEHGAAPSLPEQYVKAIDGAPVGPEEGSCGTAMYRGKQVIVTDIFQDPLWEDYRDLAAAAGLRACWSTPILSGRGKVLGSFAMYYRHPQEPTGDEARLTDVATRIAALAIEHQNAREALARTQAELARATRGSTSGETAASLSQEIDAPLNAIVDRAETYLKALEELMPDVEELREAFTHIRDEGRRALEAIAHSR
jgi:GAF domain-containing protein